MKTTRLLATITALPLLFSCTYWTESGQHIHNTNAGNVGIGTTTPESKLSVVDVSTTPVPAAYSGISSTISSPTNARAVFGAAINANSTSNYGGYFTAAGESSGVFGEASDPIRGIAGGVFHSYGTNGKGVIGLALSADESGTNYGGWFDSRGPNGIGVYGINRVSGRYGLLGDKYYGVYGNGGVAGVSKDESGEVVSAGHLGTWQFGVSGQSRDYGVFGYGYRVGVWGMSRQGTAGLFDGDVKVLGKLTAWEKDFIHPHPTDPTKEIVYTSMESPQSIIVIRGTARLIKGKAAIETPDHFRLVAADKDLQVLVTPLEDCNGMYVIKKSKNQVVVKELMGGKSNASFDYLITAPRAGFENRKVIVENTDFRPQPFETSGQFEQRFTSDKTAVTNIRNLLIANGTLTKDSKLNADTVKSSGWDISTKTSIPELRSEEN